MGVYLTNNITNNNTEAEATQEGEEGEVQEVVTECSLEGEDRHKRKREKEKRRRKKNKKKEITKTTRPSDVCFCSSSRA